MIINVTNIRYRNESALVTCTIPNYMDAIKTIAIGQSITTNESFDLNISDFSSKWVLIYYPKGICILSALYKNNQSYVSNVN